MIQIIYDTVFMPYEFDTVEEAYNHIYQRCIWNGILQTNALRLVSSNKGHLELRCPVVGDYIDVVGDRTAIAELENMLRAANLLEAPI